MELLQRKNTSIKKLRGMIFGKRTERHQARKAEGQEKVDEAEKSDDGRPKAAGDQDARAKLRAIESGSIDPAWLIDCRLSNLDRWFRVAKLRHLSNANQIAIRR